MVPVALLELVITGAPSVTEKATTKVSLPVELVAVTSTLRLLSEKEIAGLAEALAPVIVESTTSEVVELLVTMMEAEPAPARLLVFPAATATPTPTAMC